MSRKNQNFIPAGYLLKNRDLNFDELVFENSDFRSTPKKEKPSNSVKSPVAEPPLTICETSPYKYGDFNGVSSSSDLKVVSQTNEIIKFKEAKCCCKYCTQQNSIECTKWNQENTTFLGANKTKIVPLLKKLESTVEILRKTDSNLFIHFLSLFKLPKPLETIRNTVLPIEIKDKMVQENLENPKLLQTFTWKLLPMGVNLFMIGPKNCGKSLSYLPFISSFNLIKQDRFAGVLDYDGPFMVILCVNNSICKELYHFIKLLNEKCVVEVLKEETQAGQNNLDILITTPDILLSHVKSGRIKLKRLCILILEDAHKLLKNTVNTKKSSDGGEMLQKKKSNSVGDIIKIVNKIQKNRPGNKCIQLIISSEKWSENVTTLLMNLFLTPFVCFESFLQAAIYSKTIFVRKKLQNLTQKIWYLVDNLRKSYTTNKTIVFAKDEEISKLCEYLEVSGLECITISSQMTEDDLIDSEKLWCYLKDGHYKILLCDDTLFANLPNINDANWLIHFTLPLNFRTFECRFRAMANNFYSPLEESSRNQNTKTFLIFEEDTRQMYEDFWIDYQINLIPHLQF